MRVAIYCRISQDRDDEGNGVARQLEDCRAYAEQHGHLVVEECIDNDVSAYSKKPRREWQRVLALADAGDIAGVLAWRFDRLYRRPMELEQVIEKVNELKLRLELVNGMSLDLQDPAGQMIARTLVNVATTEMAFKGERTRRAFKDKAELGQWKGGQRPYGYGVDGVTVIAEEADGLRQAAQLILAGHSIVQAARVAKRSEELRLVHNRTHRNKQAPYLTSRGLRDALLSPRVVGLRSYTPLEDKRRWDERRAKGEVSGSCPPTAMFKAEWPAIISVEIQEQVRAELTARSGDRGRRPERTVLAGLLFCAECGKGMGTTSSSYACPPLDQHGCGGVAIAAAATQTYIRDLVNQMLLEMPEQNLRAPSQPFPEVPQEEWQRIEQQRAEIKELYDLGIYDFEEIKERARQLDVRKKALDDEQLRRMAEAARRRRTLGQVKDWLDSPLETQAQVIKTMIRHVIVKKARVKGRVFQPEYRMDIHWADSECGCLIEEMPTHRTKRVLNADLWCPWPRK